MKSKNPMLILVGPSGVGKSSFLERLLRDYPNMRDTVTYTTRPMRKGEQEGFPYHFVDTETFERLIAEGFFVEWARVHNRLYGTPKHQIDEAWQDKKIVVMDVDVQGAKTFKRIYPQALTVFILPPSIDSLRHRVIQRSSLPLSELELRMKNAELEIAQASDFDRSLINDDFETSYAELQKLIEEVL